MTSGNGLDAFTWSWQATQTGVTAICLILSLAVAALIFRPKRNPALRD